MTWRSVYEDAVYCKHHHAILPFRYQKFGEGEQCLKSSKGIDARKLL
eukprot:Seg190.16 transcript_id=Seg190.16/GoldUCD/mRNA.D3Y31 product="hypothetical protein" protein_id=Seg190.16/GoldUCD/D3Y31